MPVTSPPAEVLRSTFEEIALIFASIAASHAMPERAVWAFLRRLDRLRVDTLRPLADQREAAHPAEPAVEALRVHPAVEEFVARLREGAGEAGRVAS